MALMYGYKLTNEGIRRVVNNEFYLQDTPKYKGYTEKIFRLLYKEKKPLTIREISELTGIHRRSVKGIITFNVKAGYIDRIHLDTYSFNLWVSERRKGSPEE